MAAQELKYQHVVSQIDFLQSCLPLQNPWFLERQACLDKSTHRGVYKTTVDPPQHV